MSSSIIIRFVLLVLFFVVSGNAAPLFPQLFPQVYNVVSYGAVADGKTDNSKAFLKAWEDACKYEGRKAIVYIPHGTYMLKTVSFVGPCKAPIGFEIKGTLKAPNYSEMYNSNTWIGFRYVENLSVKGGGVLDGQGATAWPYNDCSRNSHCPTLPVTMRFDFVKNSKVHHIHSINSKNVHFNIFACNNLTMSHIRLTAPGNSPNTDGIHIGTSTDITISHSVIGTGDDCIAMVSGSKNVNIYDVTCGPGHGISIGSLGKSHANEDVVGVNIRNCTFIGTQNGLRIKTWAPSYKSLASDINFEYVEMKDVENPIVIDQKYCPSRNCGNAGSSSSVQIKNVNFRNIWGTSRSKVAINIQCSKLVPCQNVRLMDINLAYHGRGGPAVSSCSNVMFGSSSGKQSPPGCL